MKGYKLKILLFIIFVCIMVSVGKSCEGFVSGRITTSYTINLLTKESGSMVFDVVKDVGKYNEREISARSNFRVRVKNVDDGRREIFDMYKNNTMNFTEDEKQAITDAVNHLFTSYKDKVPLIKEWNIIKVNDEMDWGYPYTLGDNIVIPKKMIKMDVVELAKMLFHEQMHIIQRRNFGIFDEFYKNHWKFEEFELPNDPWINKYVVHNPDSDNFYIYRLTEDLYMMPLPTTFNKHYTLSEDALFLTNEKKILVKDEEPHMESLRNIVEYNNRFYGMSSLYHPNEILATLLSEMLFNDLSITERDQVGINGLFKRLKKYF